MAQKSGIWLLLAGLLCILSVCAVAEAKANPNTEEFQKCLKNDVKVFVMDNLEGFITKKRFDKKADMCILFMQKNYTVCYQPYRWWPKVVMENNSYLLYISKKHTKKKSFVLYGKQCNVTGPQLEGTSCVFNHTFEGDCHIRCLDENICKHVDYDDSLCNYRFNKYKNRFIINISATERNCINCNNPVKKPAVEIVLNTSIPIKHGELDPVEAVKVMNGLADLVSSINEPITALSAGEGVTGILVKGTESVDIKEVSFAYTSPNESLSIIEDQDNLRDFSRSVTVSKEAFEQAQSSNISVTFAAVFRFLNLAMDEMKSNVLENEVLAIEMGTNITNLTDKIKINFLNIDYKGVPRCHSWNGEGSRPHWTEDGCQTVHNGSNITCQCSHLTFFAILLAPPNETISSYDLNSLTIITQVGCGLSMFFLSIVLFMHFLLRRTQATKATRILIHLVSAMFLLNFTFLINNFVAKMKSNMGCKIMAALMHYFMLATFTWFAAQAFHLCLQLYKGGKIEIHHYMLKVSITSWIIPSIVGIVLFIIGKYGEQIIYTDNTEDNVSMCWITDSNVHFVVNIGYYVLVFLFTFTTFIIILSWLFCLKRANAGNVKVKRNGINIATILGLCCMLGITWGFAFFSYGFLRIPSYYIFTVLNSFQGFFLFIYYYTTSHSRETNTTTGDSKTSSTSTLKTGLDILENPYTNLPGKKKSSKMNEN